ncbi:core-2/I-branching enzyme, partial [Lactobacillus helveticus]|nr:core-2/I-branching enzyme [Lactobacillus helveticus]
MGKHAYLIIANRNPNQLNLLLKTIDDSRNDIRVPAKLDSQFLVDD